MPPEEEGLRPDQAPDQGRRRHPGAADRPRAGSARRQHHGVLQGVQRGDRVAARQRRPGRDHGLRGPLVHLHHQDAAGRRADQEGRRRRQGLRRRRTPSRSPRSPRRRSARSRRPSSRTSTPTTSTPRRRSSPAPPARWASPSRTDPAAVHDRTPAPTAHRTTAPTQRQHEPHRRTAPQWQGRAAR